MRGKGHYRRVVYTVNVFENGSRILSLKVLWIFYYTPSDDGLLMYVWGIGGRSEYVLWRDF